MCLKYLEDDWQNGEDMSNIIEVKNICKSYSIGGEELRVLNNISLTVQEGEFVAIIGPSGSGKSTLMNVIGCLDLCDSGLYILDNMNIKDLSDDELAEIRNNKIGFIFQQFNLLNRLTAIENIELPLIYKGMESEERNKLSLQAIERVGLSNRKNHTPNQLSGGQEQRVAIARALVTNPKILLADEPTGALDSRSSREILQIIKELNSEGRTVIMITHDNSIAGEAERIIQIRDGKIYE